MADSCHFENLNHRISSMVQLNLADNTH